MTLRQVPGRLAVLLILPLLVYITMASNDRTQRELRHFLNSLAQKNIAASPATAEALKQIVTDEMRQDQTTWVRRPDESPDARAQRLRDHIATWDSRILSRARGVLDDAQYLEFQRFEQRRRDDTLRQLNEVSDPWSLTEPFYYWLIMFYFLSILPLTCVRGCGPLIRDELQADTLGFLITRPLGRARLLVLKYAAQVAWLQIVLLVETLLLFTAGAACRVPDLGALLPLVLGVQVLAVTAWSALGLLLGQLTPRYMVAALVYGAIVELGIGRIPTNINVLSMLRHLQTLLAQNTSVHAFYEWAPDKMGTAIAALILAPVLFLGASAFLFSVVEYHHATEMQK